MIGIDKVHHQGIKEESPTKDKGFWDRKAPTRPYGKSTNRGQMAIWLTNKEQSTL